VAEDQDYDANGLSSDQVQNKRELTVNLCLDLVLSLLKKIVLQVQEPPSLLRVTLFFQAFSCDRMDLIVATQICLSLPQKMTVSHSCLGCRDFGKCACCTKDSHWFVI